jgi:hypothetical protein
LFFWLCFWEFQQRKPDHTIGIIIVMSFITIVTTSIIAIMHIAITIVRCELKKQASAADSFLASVAASVEAQSLQKPAATSAAAIQLTGGVFGALAS